MNDYNQNERFDFESISATDVDVLRLDTAPVMFGSDCMICGTFIEGVRAPVICNYCRRRLMRVLYPNRREEL